MQVDSMEVPGLFFLFKKSSGIFGIFAQNLPLWSLRPSLTAGMTKIPEILGLFCYFFCWNLRNLPKESSSEKVASITAWVIAPWHSHGRTRSMAGQIGHPVDVGATGRTSGVSAPLQCGRPERPGLLFLKLLLFEHPPLHEKHCPDKFLPRLF